jgi:nucleotidyltransferase/DNA polymerase involved in DNA repair
MSIIFQSNFVWLDTLMRATEDDLKLTLTRINDAADLTETTAARLKASVYSALAKLMDARSALRDPDPSAESRRAVGTPDESTSAADSRAPQKEA